MFNQLQDNMFIEMPADHTEVVPVVQPLTTINILVKRISSDGDVEFLIKNQEVEFDSAGNIRLKPLLDRIHNLGLDFSPNHIISYYSEVEHIYIFAGRFPISENFVIQREEVNWLQN